MRFSLRRPRMAPWHPGWVSSVSIVGLLFYFEIISYNFPSWHRLDCRSAANCTRILIVADPQLIGFRNEHLGILTYISIWDSDSFLRSTYRLANFHAKPDVVLFVGDLFDEGSIALEMEYKQFVDRFDHIFQFQPNRYFHRPISIFVPGDNDIGGEGIEPVKDLKIKYFNNAFGYNDVISIDNTSFYRVNALKRSYPEISLPIEDPEAQFAGDESTLRVIVSHMPLIFKPTLFSETVLNALKPHIIFAGHEHSAMIVAQDPINQARHVTPVTHSDVDVHRMELRMQTYELISPTCSYRMGTVSIGYGFAVIEGNELRYTVLWSPSRFHQLGIYLLAVVLNFFYFIYYRWKLKRMENGNGKRRKLAESKIGMKVSSM